jgi:hypothetical protein
VNSVSKYAFANQNPSDKELIIQLAKNKINPNSFTIGSLSGSQRPIKLKLGQEFVGCNRDLTYLEEYAFSSFLDKEGNELDMGCSYIMQCDCRMKWLYDAPDFWRNRIKSGPLGDTVLPCNYEAENDDEEYSEVSFWDLPEEYFNCNAKNRDSLDLVDNKTAKNDLENIIDDFIEYL